MSLKGCVSVSVVELAMGGSATNQATPSSLLLIIQTEIWRETICGIIEKVAYYG